MKMEKKKRKNGGADFLEMWALSSQIEGILMMIWWDRMKNVNNNGLE